MKCRALALIPALALVLAACGGPSGEEPDPPSTLTDATVPEETAGQEPLQPSPLPSVYTDWSKLEPYTVEERYTRYYEGPVDRLLPVQGGYGGALISFYGERLSGAEWWGHILRYGLATADGTVVCDPVYSEVRTQNGYLILERTDLAAGSSRDTEDRVTVAASDGSWVLGSEYRRVWSMSDGRLLLRDAAGGLWFCDRDGILTASPLIEAFSRQEETGLEELTWGSFYDGVGVFCVAGRMDSWLLNAVTGESKHLPDVMGCFGWSGDDPWAVAYTEDRYGYLDRDGAWAIPPRFQWAGEFQGDCACVETEEGEALIDRSGQVIVRAQGRLYTATDRSGNIYCLDRTWNENGDGETITAVYDSEGRLMPDHPLTGRDVMLYDCAVTTAEDQVTGNSTVRNGLMTLWDYDGTVLGTIEGVQGAALQGCENGRAVLYRWEAATGGNGGVYDLAAGAWVVPMGKYANVYAETDGTDTVYVAWMKNTDGYDILREDGTLVAHVDMCYDFTRGLLQCMRGDASVWLDLNGEAVFRWSIRTNTD